MSFEAHICCYDRNAEAQLTAAMKLTARELVGGTAKNGERLT